MRSLYLVRHAEPELTGVILGGRDPGLSLVGKRQAGRVALPAVAAIYTSELRRSKETGIAISSPGVLVVPDADLNEISYGDWDGRTWSDIEQEFPVAAAAKLKDWFGVTPPGGEEWQVFARRVNRALERVRAGPFPAAVVGHVAVHAVMAHALSGSDPTRFMQRHAEVLRYEL